MECLTCGRTNPDGNRFCGNCGELLPQCCPICSVENAPGKRFCSACGATLPHADNLRTVFSTPSAAIVTLPRAERRHLSVMFCDIVGSTSLASHLDPEKLQELTMRYQEKVTAAVSKFGGFVARYIGDGILVYFGWPIADEADTERAVRGGLAAIEAAGLVSDNGEALRVRVAIATGLVVVGSVIGTGPAQEHVVVGETPNLASRLQSLAEPNTLVICEYTHREVAALFECQEEGKFDVKGFNRPVSIWRVIRAKGILSRFEARHVSALPPLIGRDEELGILARRWGQINRGESAVVLVSGEPGIGKSRLVAALMERLQGEHYVRLRYFCSSYHRDSALHPIIAEIERLAGFSPIDQSDEKLNKLQAALSPFQPGEDDLSLISDLLSLSVSDRLVPAIYTPLKKKEKTLETICRWMEHVAAERPLLIIFEDMHWADPTTCELVDLIIGRLLTQRILLIFTTRPELVSPWVGQSGVTLITLNRLGRRDAAVIASRIEGASALSSELLASILEQSDGIPLFIEELTKSVVEANLGTPDKVPKTAVPRSLQGSLLARLDRLPDAKHVAQIGAVIGREFSYRLLSTVASMREPTLLQGLEQLCVSGLLLARGRPPEAIYRFKHALVQDTAYESLLHSSRSGVHGRIAEALRQLRPEVEVTRPELLAQHYALAGLGGEAAEYYRRAAEQSITRSAIKEARAHLERGLALVEAMPENAQRHAIKARLLLALGSVSVITEGYGGDGLATIIDDAVVLSRHTGERQLLIRALFGKWACKVHAAELATALTVAEEMVGLAALEEDPIVRIVAFTSLAINYAYSGRLVEARDLFEKCLAEPSISTATNLGSPHPQDHEVLARTYLSRTLTCLGEGERATREAQKSIERARNLKHYPSLAMALTMGCRQAWLMRDETRVQEHATELMKLSEEQGFPYWLARGRCYAGWVAVGQGRTKEGLALLNEAVSYLEGTDVAMGNIAGLLADAHARGGDFFAGLKYVDEALRVSSRTGEVWMDAELHRLKGDMFIALSDSDVVKAEIEFVRAIDIARNQEAKLWELRASMSLARLWRCQGRFIEALNLLQNFDVVVFEKGSVIETSQAQKLYRELTDTLSEAQASRN
jgi:class 3 adenylate cyclase/tetratricopeptide (TPR) repeat protein